MKVIPTRIHGVLDYLVGATLLAIPFLLGWNYPEALMLQILGGATIVASLFTSYELGLFKVIPMAVHLILDTFVALFLIVAPLAYANIDEVPGYIMMALGATELLSGVLSLTWGLILSVLRQLPGRALAPIRWLTIAYMWDPLESTCRHASLSIL